MAWKVVIGSDVFSEEVFCFGSLVVVVVLLTRFVFGYDELVVGRVVGFGAGLGAGVGVVFGDVGWVARLSERTMPKR